MTKCFQFTQLIVGAVLLSNVACTNGLQFSSTDTTKPGVNCVTDPETLSVPVLVQQGQSFSMSYNRNSVAWKLQNGTTQIQFDGSQVDTTLNDVGNYIGSVAGTNNCNKEDGQEFVIRVIERVAGLDLVINNNDIYTRQQTVALSLSAVGATQMYLTNVSNCSAGGSWETYSTTKAWSLGETNKLTRVYAKYKNDLAETPCISDDITHDNQAPSLRFVSSPAALTSSKTANLQFAVEDLVSGVKALYCKLDTAAYQVCALNVTYNNLSEGSHTASIYAEDKAGNISQVETQSWIIDSVLPTVRITQAPSNPSTSRSANFVFDGEDSGVAITEFECSLDAATFQRCSSPKAYTNLAQGSHTFKVKGKDRAGNFSAEASHVWTIDSLAPTVLITSAPTNPTKDLTAHFAFTVQDLGLGIASIKCQLDTLASTTCSNTIDYAGLVNGTHTFKVTAIDLAGNSGTAAYTWEVNDKITDQVIPVVDAGGSTDILFLMNTAGSMHDIYYNKIGLQFSKFISNLGSMDYRIGVVTSDYRDGGSPYREGRIVPVEDLNPRQYMLTPSTHHVGDHLLSTLARREVTCAFGTWTGPNGSFCGTTGWNLPVSTQVIRAGLRTFDHVDNQSFFRAESSLNIVIVADSDEVCSSGMYGSDGACMAQDSLHSAEAFLAKLRSTFGEKSIKVHTLVHRPGDIGCDMGASNSGDTYIKLSQLTGGVSRSICKTASSEGTAIAQAIQSSSQQVFQLKCAPVDRNNDNVVDAKDITASFTPAITPAPQMTVSGSTLRFSPSIAAGTKISLQYMCP